MVTLAALALAVLLVALLMFRAGGGPHYHLDVTLLNANQLVRGNQVKVGGVPVGSIESIDLADDARAKLRISITDEDLVPLHAGSRVQVRSSSVSGVANRYLALTPGPNDRAEIEDGGAIPAEDASGEVDLDEVLNSLDPEALRDLKLLVRNLGSGLSGRGRELGEAVDALNPALSQVDATEREILRDQGTFARFLVESADVVSAVAERRDRLGSLVANGRATLDALASESEALDSSLRRLPPTLRQANTTLVNVRALVGDLRPAVRAAGPVAAPLAGFLGDAQPTLAALRPIVARLRATIDRPGGNDLIGVLRGLPPVARAAIPTLRSLLATVKDALPIVREARPYVPDLTGGLANGFGGTTAGYYDANGRYTRISFQASAYSLQSIASLIPTPPALRGLTGYRKDVVRRCPGGATQPGPDGSNPYVADPASCSPEGTR